MDLWVDPNVGGKSGVGALKESHLIYVHADGLTHCTFRFFFFYILFLTIKGKKSTCISKLCF